MVVIDPEKFMPKDLFLERIDDILDEFKTCPHTDEIERVIIPGEIEGGKERISRDLGIELSDSVVQELYSIGKTYGVTADF